MPRYPSFWDRYSAAIILVAVALAFNVTHFVLEVLVEPEQGTVGFWLNTTAENLQSELWQIAAAAFVWKHWRWHGSPESKDVEQ